MVSELQFERCHGRVGSTPVWHRFSTGGFAAWRQPGPAELRLPAGAPGAIRHLASEPRASARAESAFVTGLQASQSSPPISGSVAPRHGVARLGASLPIEAPRGLKPAARFRATIPRRTRTTRRIAGIATLLTGLLAPTAFGQPNNPGKVDLKFNQFYNFPEMVDALEELVAAYPKFLTLESLGKSTEGRDMWLVTINNPDTGSHRDKPAIYIDANVHGNEVQGTEVCLYTIWYLMKSYGVVEKLTKAVDERAFYVIPSVNPDGRAHWFDDLNTSSSSRSGKEPRDNDYDGLYDEDGYDDLDGDGYVTVMWRPDPNGRFRRSQKDPRIFERVGPDEKGEWDFAGMEGIDNDGDGRINEDGPGGYDMNRNWPSDWQPEYIQGGAGEYPFSQPETACIGAFLLDHPNVAAVQSYHNSGGMILRGPGANYREGVYPRSDTNVYDEIGRTGERILPYYRYMIIYKDLYTVHGGFVNWTSEGLGIFSFTNELWNDDQFYYGKEGDWNRDEQSMKFRDLLQFGETFVDYKPFDHPTYGPVLIGGSTKYASRVPPVFMLEELCHRNFAFTMYHADQMPRPAFGRTWVKEISPSVWSLTVELRNEAAIPTISGIAAQKQIGARDHVTLTAAGGIVGGGAGQDDGGEIGQDGGGEAGAGKGGEPGHADAVGAPGDRPKVLASGTVREWYDTTMDLTKRKPERIWLDRGLGSREGVLCRWIIAGDGDVEVTYWSQKGGQIARTITLASE